MKKVTDIAGQVFGRLKVVEFAYRKNLHTLWKCVCECGNERIVEGSKLKDGRTKSCGCWKIEMAKLSNRKHGFANKHRLYGIWKKMRERCRIITSQSYRYYGKRGITICKEWDDFQVFYDWAVENGYNDKLTLDRRNNDGNYEPSNCRWATMAQQNQNQSSTKLNSVKVMTIRNLNRIGAFTTSELAKIYGVSSTNIKYIINNKNWI